MNGKGYGIIIRMLIVWKAAAATAAARTEGALTQHEKFYISWKAFSNLNIIAKKGINSLNCYCYSSRAHTQRDTQSSSLKAEVKYSRHNSFLLGAGKTFEQLFEEQLEKSHSSLLWENVSKSDAIGSVPSQRIHT